MIEFENNGKVVTIEFDEETQRYAIKAAKTIKVPPKEPYDLKTGVKINFTHLLDEIVILNETNDGLQFCVVSDAYRAADNADKEIELTLFFNGSKTLTLNEGDILAYAICYHKCTDDSPALLPVFEKDMPIVYLDDTLRVQSVTGEQIDIETVTEPDGTRYVKIPLPKEVIE